MRVWQPEPMNGTELAVAARGRSLCLSLLCARSDPLTRHLQQLERDLERRIGFDYPRIGTLRPTSEQLTRLAEAITAVDVGPLATETDPLRLLAGLGDAVDSAMPWQPPFIRDALTAFPAVRDALLPAADAIAAAPGAHWWNDPIDLAHQYEMHDLAHRTDEQSRPAQQILEDLRAAATYDERRHGRPPVDPADEPGDAWWSIPTGWIPKQLSARLPHTSRRLPELGAVELAAQEDSTGPARAELRHVEPVPRSPRVFEVHGPDDWTRLVNAYPFEATRTRRGVWWESTGIDGRWYIPDWLTAAADWDAIHLTVWGYLTTAGEALPATEGGTVLAGWNPDCTYWLCDVRKTAADTWIRTSDTDMTHWARSSDG